MVVNYFYKCTTPWRTVVYKNWNMQIYILLGVFHIRETKKKLQYWLSSHKQNRSPQKKYLFHEETIEGFKFEDSVDDVFVFSVCWWTSVVSFICLLKKETKKIARLIQGTNSKSQLRYSAKFSFQNFEPSTNPFLSLSLHIARRYLDDPEFSTAGCLDGNWLFGNWLMNGPS